jgi:hypothetical protein
MAQLQQVVLVASSGWRLAMEQKRPIQRWCAISWAANHYMRPARAMRAAHPQDVTTLIAVYTSDGCVGRCDARCYGATEPACECICTGANHGVGYARAAENTIRYAQQWVLRHERAHPDHEVVVPGVHQQLVLGVPGRLRHGARGGSAGPQPPRVVRPPMQPEHAACTAEFDFSQRQDHADPADRTQSSLVGLPLDEGIDLL